MADRSKTQEEKECQKDDAVNINNSEECKALLKYEKRICTIKVLEFVCTGVLLLAILISLVVVVVIQFTGGSIGEGTSVGEAYKLVAEICSTYTGIILGFVAMTVSLFGMILSFHNTKQAEESNLEMAKEFAGVKHKLSDVREVEKSLSEAIKELRGKLDDIDKFKDIESRLDELSREMRENFDKNKGSSTERSTTVQGKRERAEEEMVTDEHYADK